MWEVDSAAKLQTGQKMDWMSIPRSEMLSLLGDIGKQDWLRAMVVESNQRLRHKRGIDTRLNFTDYLYEALVSENISTFLDEQEVETGEELKPELTRAIKGSRASIIVLSKNYASSSWCLDELVLILEQRKQESSFGEALLGHKRRMGLEKDEEKKRQAARKLESWTEALKEVADLKGKDSVDEYQNLKCLGVDELG
ncbi:Toll/interleukin-1 receptor domain-containing protein [Tanacetum coccineum]